MEGGLLGHDGVGLRGHAVGDRHRESVLGSVHADVDVGDLPAVGGIDVVGARGRGAEQIVRRPQQDVVAGARPRLVGDQGVGQVKGRVVEEIERVPAGAGLDPPGHQLAVEVVGAVDVARIAEVLVIPREAGETEVVMAPDRVLDDLHQRVLIVVEALAIEAGRRVGRAHQRARRGRIEPSLDPALELASVEGEEVRALLALDVDDLDVLTRLDLVRGGAREADAEVQPRLGERRRQLDVLELPRRRAPDLDQQRGRRPVALDHAAAGSGDDNGRGALGDEALRSAPRRALVEQAQGPGVVRQQTPGVQGTEHALGAPVAGQPAKHRRLAVGAGADRRRVLAALGVEHGHLGDLAPVAVDHGEPVVGAQPHGGRRTRPDPVRLERPVDRAQAGGQQRRSRGDGHGQAFAASVFTSASSACWTSCSASSRLASGSSFLTSFSTTRRL